MTISESDRRAIFVGLEPILGPEAADNLLAMLPNQPAAQLVTRDDLHAHTIMLRGEMAELRAEMKGDMGDLRSELRGEMGELRSELRSEMGDLRTDVRTEIAALRVSTQRWMSGAVAANTIAVVTALVT